MAGALDRIPSLTDWRTAASTLGLERRGGELVGPCPVCRGRDRFRVTRQGGFFCRRCCPDGHAGADAMRRILEAAGLAREENGESLSAGAARRAAGRPPRQSDRSGRVSEYRGSSESRSTAIYGGRNSGGPAKNGEFGGPGGNSARGAPDASGADMATIAVANRIWGATMEDTAPVRAYRAARGAWPPDTDLPSAVRWLSLAAAERLNLFMPRQSAGAVVYAFGLPGERRLRAVQIEPLTADGSRAPWPARKPGGKPVARQSRGPMRGAAFPVKPRGADPAGPLHVAEGPVDALAIAFWRGVQAWAGGGASGLVRLLPALAATGREIVIEADDDPPGRSAATALQDALHCAGASARLIYWPGCDPADGLAANWEERAAILENDAGMTRVEAEAAAWNAMRPAGIGKPAGRDMTDPMAKGPTDDRNPEGKRP